MLSIKILLAPGEKESKTVCVFMILICLRTCASLISYKKTAHNAEMVSMKGDGGIDFANTHIISVFRLFSCRTLPHLTGICKIQFTALLASNSQYRVYYLGSSLPLDQNKY